MTSDGAKKFPCGQCGARLEFSPAVRQLQCPYCAAVVQTAASADEIRELDFDSYIESQAENQGSLAALKCEVRCNTCGAIVLLPGTAVTEACPYCSSFIRNEPVEAQAMILPESILPFQIDKRQAQQAFRDWIASRWFAPSDLVRNALAGEIHGLYVPYWTYDSMTISYYTGMRGDNYWETETYTVTNAKGETETQTRQVMKTRWTPASGRVDHLFDDVLILGSTSLPKDYMEKLEPWDLPSLVPFDEAYLAGFRTERYQVDLKEGFRRAKNVMDAHIRTLCCRDIGGDQQQLSSVKSQYLSVTFKHLLLPVWHSAYRYHDKTFHIVINARTGEVQGARPISWAKIAGLVVAIAGALGLIAFLAHALGR